MGKLNSLKEKRKSPRLLLYLPLEYQVMEAPYVHKGLVINASKEGFLIHSLKDMPVGTRLSMAVSFPKGFELNNFEVVARIVWRHHHQAKDREEYRYGLEFIEILEGGHERLNRLLGGRLQKEESGTGPRSGTVNFEMRRYPRVAVDFPVEYYRINSPIGHAGRAINASEGGLMVSLSEKAEIGQHLKFVVFIGSGSNLDTIQMLAKVVWLDIHLGEDWGDYRSGVMIIDIAPEDRKKLKDFIEGFLK